MNSESREAELHFSCGSVAASSAGVMSVAGALSPEIARCSENQAPRSMRRQRSLQKGRNAEPAHSSSRPQVGQATVAGLIAAISSAAREGERDVFLSLARSRGEAFPGQEAQIAAMVTAADLRIEPGGGGQ